MTKQVAYVSINKLCDKLEEFIKDHSVDSAAGLGFANDLKTNAYEYYVLFSKDTVYEDRFDSNYVVFKPILISLWKRQQLKYNDLCKLFECEKLYIKAKSKGAHYNINTKENLQNLVIEREPKKFTNRDGKEIVYHDIRNYDTYSLVKEIESRLKTNYQQFIKECGL